MKGPRLRGQDLHDELAKTGWGYWSKIKGPKLLLVPGDRVVLLEGRDKGKIGTITAVDWKRAECTVQGLNLV